MRCYLLLPSTTLHSRHETFFVLNLFLAGLLTFYILEQNRIYHSDWMNNTLPDKSVQLIIADPPYFETKGHFDFVWNSFDEYLTDVERWAKECKRVLAENGTLFWFGSSKLSSYHRL